jgi:hypothetical protein
MLFDLGKPAEALAAFGATLKKEPNRLGAMPGAVKAAAKAADSAKAAQHYRAAAALTESGEPGANRHRRDASFPGEAKVAP